MSPYHSEPKFNSPDEIDGPDDVHLPKFEHHTRIKAELSRLVELEKITGQEAEDLYTEWKN